MLEGCNGKMEKFIKALPEGQRECLHRYLMENPDEWERPEFRAAFGGPNHKPAAGKSGKTDDQPEADFP